MGKFAPVAPARIYAEMGDSLDDHGYKPDRVLLLAHDVVKDAKTYSSVFTATTQWEDTFIIMDNSVIELGSAVDMGMVKEACDIVAANAVVLPDIVNDKDSTELTLRNWDAWSQMFFDLEKMVLIQGKTLADWLWSAEQLAPLEPEWVGIPRITEHFIGNDEKVHRDELAKLAKAIFVNNPHIHLFGFSDYVAQDLMCAAAPWVDSIDSAVPLRMTSNNILTSDPGKRGNWWDLVQWDESMARRCQLVDDYIDRFAEIAAGE